MTASIASMLEDAAQARREGRLADARRDALAAVDLGRGSGVASDLVAALKLAGQVERELGDRKAAVAFHEEAVALGRELGDLAALAHTLRHLGDLHHETGRPGPARPLYEEALALYREDPVTRPLDLANALRPLARLEQETGKYFRARRLWAEARDLYEALAVEAGVEECEEALARLER